MIDTEDIDKHVEKVIELTKKIYNIYLEEGNIEMANLHKQVLEKINKVEEEWKKNNTD